MVYRNMFEKKILFLFILMMLTSCHDQKQKNIAQEFSNIPKLVDDEATLETKNLYKNLFKLKNKGFIFGHQDDLAYGVHWKYESGKSDVKEVTGDYPGLYGWDVGGIEKKSSKNIDGVPFEKMIKFIQEVYERGGINTISWHMDNPLNDKNSWDTTKGSLASAAVGGIAHEKYKSWLDDLVLFNNQLKDKNGNSIPILFRPFHELTGNWFWWCQNNGSSEVYINLWRFTVDYLKSKGVHNFIYVYNTSIVTSKEAYLKYYPGSDYVDVLSFDNYQYNNPDEDPSFVENNLKLFGILDTIAKKENKLIAFAETGYEQIPYAKWWTETLMNSMGKYEISFVLAWRNHGFQITENKMHYYVPFKGHPNEKDFVDFYHLKQTLFQKEITREKVYQ
jgi:mannan endo-1,4-beta-mannosidase